MKMRISEQENKNLRPGIAGHAVRPANPDGGRVPRHKQGNPFKFAAPSEPQRGGRTAGLGYIFQM
jgi:hypothetical protein